MRVYKFVPENHGISNLALRRLKVSTIDSLNDPFEFLAPNLLDARHLNAFKKTKDRLCKDKGLISFSKSWASPLLWGIYADNHKGLVLGFDIPDDYLTNVIYTSQRPKVKFDITTRKLIDGNSVIDHLIRTKFNDWQYEDESRLFCHLDATEAQGGLHFVNFSDEMKLQQVIVGMASPMKIDDIRNLVSDQIKPNRVIKAGMHRSKFKVIEDRNFR